MFHENDLFKSNLKLAMDSFLHNHLEVENATACSIIQTAAILTVADVLASLDMQVRALKEHIIP